LAASCCLAGCGAVDKHSTASRAGLSRASCCLTARQGEPGCPELAAAWRAAPAVRWTSTARQGEPGCPELAAAWRAAPAVQWTSTARQGELFFQRPEPAGAVAASTGCIVAEQFWPAQRKLAAAWWAAVQSSLLLSELQSSGRTQRPALLSTRRLFFLPSLAPPDPPTPWGDRTGLPVVFCAHGRAGAAWEDSEIRGAERSELQERCS
jgi:hypothetical protein